MSMHLLEISKVAAFEEMDEDCYYAAALCMLTITNHYRLFLFEVHQSNPILISLTTI